MRYLTLAIPLALTLSASTTATAQRTLQPSALALRLTSSRTSGSAPNDTLPAHQFAAREATSAHPLGATLRQQRADNRPRNAIIGGLVGAAIGMGVCVAISTAIDHSARTGPRMCEPEPTLHFGGGGFLVGALFGYLMR